MVKHNGFAIAIAWPQTYCKQPGAWYDPITLLLGINKNNYYKVGHAALVLIDGQNLKAHYFDFGRYHAPYKQGRVRSAETDHELALKTIPQLAPNAQTITNLHALLTELQHKPACHGEGELHAAYCPINFEMALDKALQMQYASPIPYGPFSHNGSNCSRFVNTAILAGKPRSAHYLRLRYQLPLTPTPISNVKALDHYMHMPKLLTGETFCPLHKLPKQQLVSTLPEPERHPNIPATAMWLSGEGAGSWFHLKLYGTLLMLTRYSPQGVVECTGQFHNQAASDILRTGKPFTVSYPSNCKMVFIKVDGFELRFTRAA